ncbi:hypothetical protein [Rhizorhabdus dicambivorans]|uniref:hypothetical protein n=1 Tax=Rhizorhabdus dicambivorans TaxID=1850238 RepID=UPI001112A053|nr:hypothetical protein [Rhizorhabdus dicambivorans]
MRMVLAITALIAHAAVEAQPPSDKQCLDHRIDRSLNSTKITATNHCTRPLLANICARVEGRIGEEKQGHRIEPGRSHSFDLFNPKQAQVSYNIAHCEPGTSLRLDLCVPSCPPDLGTSETTKGIAGSQHRRSTESQNGPQDTSMNADHRVKQAEAELAAARDRYSDKHPEVIFARQKLIEARAARNRPD